MRSSGPSPDLDVYDIAFLAGGPERVVDTALVALVESGRVRVHAPGELAVAEPVRAHPVEAAVMDAVGTQGHRSVDTIRWRLAGDERVSDLGRSLSSAGLLRRRIRWGRRGSDDLDWSLTAAGREALDRLSERPPTLPAFDGGSSLHVALYGRATMPDTDLRASIFERPLPPLPPGDRGSALRRRMRLAEDADPSLAAYRTRGAAGYGGAGGGFDGGGGGGGDGGGGF